MRNATRRTQLDPRDANLRRVGFARSASIKLGTRMLLYLAAEGEDARRQAEQDLHRIAEDYLERTGPFMEPFIPQLNALGRQDDVRLIRASRGELREQLAPAALAALDVGRARYWVHRGEQDLLPALTRLMQAFVEVEDREFAQTRQRMDEAEQAAEATLREIERISDTVRLIAINVSIEAARAGGRTGRGFAVIAEEIRVLSERSAALTAHMRSAGDPPSGPPSTHPALALNEGPNGKGHGRNEIHAELAERPSGHGSEP